MIQWRMTISSNSNTNVSIKLWYMLDNVGFEEHILALKYIVQRTFIFASVTTKLLSSSYLFFNSHWTKFINLYAFYKIIFISIYPSVNRSNLWLLNNFAPSNPCFIRSRSTLIQERERATHLKGLCSLVLLEHNKGRVRWSVVASIEAHCVPLAASQQTICI